MNNVKKYLKNDFVQEIYEEYGISECKPVLEEDMNDILLHSKNVLRPGDSFSFYSLPLYVVTRIVKPKVVIETGVQNGGSSQTILAGLAANNFGTLYSIDSGMQSTDGTHTSTFGSPGEKITSYLKKYWKLNIGYSYDIFPQLLPNIEKVDLFFHDSDHSKKNVEYEFEAIKPYLNRNGLVGLHDHYGQWNHKQILPVSEFKFFIGHNRPEAHQHNGEYHNVLRLWKKLDV